MGFYKDGRWQPDAAEMASGEYMPPESEMAILRRRIEELESENGRLREERLAFATAQAELEMQLQAIRKGHTKTVEYDLSPAMVESALRSKLIELGWTPPPILNREKSDG